MLRKLLTTRKNKDVVFAQLWIANRWVVRRCAAVVCAEMGLRGILGCNYWESIEPVIQVVFDVQRQRIR